MKKEEGFIQEYIEKRLDMILFSGKKENERYYEEQEKILASLDEGSRAKFEQFVKSVNMQEMDEYALIYKEAFMDGLRLGHKTFT